MPYCTTDDLIAHWTTDWLEGVAIDTPGQALDDEGPTAILEDAIAHGDARVDSAISNRYATPVTLAEIPKALQDLSLRAARTELAKRRPQTYSETDKAFDEALQKDLDAIGEGKARIAGLTQTCGLAYSTRSEYDAIEDNILPNRSLGTDPLAGWA